MEETIRSQIICPQCKTIKDFSFSKSIINPEDFITTVFFTRGNICEHQFNAYIDMHGKVRGYQLINFVVPSFEEESSQLSQPFKKELKSKDIDFEIIEMNFTFDFLMYIFRIIFFRKKTIILENDNLLINHLTNLLEYLTEDSFNYYILFYSKKKYEAVKKSFKDYVVIEKDKIVNNPSKFLSKRKKKRKNQLKFENYLINKFLALKSYEFFLQVLRDEIHKIYSLSSVIANYAQEIKDQQKLNISKIKEVLKAKDITNEYNPYIDYLIEIAGNYFSAKLPFIFSTVLSSI